MPDNMPETIWAVRSDDEPPQYRATPFGIWWHDEQNGYTQYVRADAAEAKAARMRERAGFLLDRLDEWVPQAECDLPENSHALRDLGHVRPAIARLRAAIEGDDHD